MLATESSIGVWNRQEIQANWCGNGGGEQLGAWINTDNLSEIFK